MSFKYIYMCIAIVLCMAQCTNLDKPIQSPDGYNLNQPERMSVPERLVEISGIALKDGNSETIFSIQDEEGRLFKLAWKNKELIHQRFAANGDFEDIAILKNTAYILRSDGTVFSVAVDDFTNEEKKEAAEWKKIIPKEEYEGMYADAQNNQLYILCKKCSSDKNRNGVTGYILSVLPDSSIRLQTSFTLNTEAIIAKTGKKLAFQPSALARHPLTGQWYILSSVNKLLVIADSNFNVLHSYPLHGKEFNQPEGIAFDSGNNLYISNEGDEITNGNILKFSYKEAH